MRLQLIFCLNILLIFELIAQQVVDSVPLTSEFEFKDGIYLNFDMLKRNSPISRFQIISSFSKWDSDFYDKLLSQRQIAYMDSGKVKVVNVKDIFAYSDNGILYLNTGNDFAKVNNKGFLMHFAGYVVEQSWWVPYYYDEFDVAQWNREKETLKEFILDFNEGKVYPFNVYNVMKLFEKYDPQLYQEFKKLSPKKRRNLLFFYIRKFNQRNKTYVYITKNH